MVVVCFFILYLHSTKASFKPDVILVCDPMIYTLLPMVAQVCCIMSTIMVLFML